MEKKVIVAVLFLMFSTAYAGDVNIYIDNSSGSVNYNKRYTNTNCQNPPRQSLMTNGYYVVGSSKVRYIHSNSRLKSARHAARINYYNDMYD